MFQLPILDDRPRPAARARAARERRIPPPLRLLPGEWVEVESEEAIYATLDDEGTLDALPFMPEMRKLCGRRFRVKARADRTICEVVHDPPHGGRGAPRRRALRRRGPRRLLPRVPDLLEGGLAPSRRAGGAGARGTRPAAPSPPPRLVTRKGDRYFCQATELARATHHLPAWRLDLHVAALVTEGVSPLDLDPRDGHLRVRLHRAPDRRSLGVEQPAGPLQEDTVDEPGAPSGRSRAGQERARDPRDPRRERVEPEDGVRARDAPLLRPRAHRARGAWIG